MEIIGVDFSGARLDNNTWLAEGSLEETGLVLRRCRPVSRMALAELLVSLPGTAVAALDFPFSVPLAFARHWMPQARAMPELWAAAARMEFPEFLALRDEFVAQYGEPKRQCDLLFPECYSCLHKTNPNMVPMTFRGMQMLDWLWWAGCEVPPLPPPRDENRPVLLESMPGAVLRALGLPYKGYKNGQQALRLRQQVLEGLQIPPNSPFAKGGAEIPTFSKGGLERFGLPLPNLVEFQALCLDRHDCLDAVVAAVTAALWARDPTRFNRPPEPGQEGFDPVVLLEGWLYVPAASPAPGQRQSLAEPGQNK